MRLQLVQTEPHSICRYVFWRYATETNRQGQHLAAETLLADKSHIVTSLKKLGFVVPPLTWLLQQACLGLKRLAGRPRQPKKPFLPKHIEAVGRLLLHQDGTFDMLEHRNLLVLAMGVSMMLRGSKVAAILIKNVEVLERQGRLWLKLFIPESKTDKGKRGAIVMTPNGAITTGWSLVRLYREYVKRLGRDTGPLFSARPETEWKRDTPASALVRATIAQITKKMAVLLKWDPKDVASHSLRRGGATAAAEKGIPERIISRHGRWSQVSKTVRRYIDEFEDDLLHLSFTLGFGVVEE
mmetsp:Transcript_12156/g.20633  ORF Transcript_12156/g.20633 Transcript_12156/m.20633 type:complete len:297 (+) Transcript_12156:643-1533(+)